MILGFSFEKNNGAPFLTDSPSFTTNLGVRLKKSSGFRANVLGAGKSTSILLASPSKFKFDPLWI